MNDGAVQDVFTADIEYRLQVVGHLDCECSTYLMTNRARLFPIFLETAKKQNKDVDEIIAQFVKGVHQRHLNGGDIFR